MSCDGLRSSAGSGLTHAICKLTKEMKPGDFLFPITTFPENRFKTEHQGNSFQFRVLPLNECGYGEPMATFGYTEIEKESHEVVLREFKPKDVQEAPKFMTSLNSRGLISAYGTYIANFKAKRFIQMEH